MSSNESDLDDNAVEILVTHQIPWLSESVNNFKQTLDAEALRSKSTQSRRQMKRRIEGSQSVRQRPDNSDYPEWVFT